MAAKKKYDFSEVLISRQQLADKVAELGAKIRETVGLKPTPWTMPYTLILLVSIKPSPAYLKEQSVED